MSDYYTVYDNVRVVWDKSTDYLSIEDKESGKQLALLYVEEED